MEVLGCRFKGLFCRFLLFLAWRRGKGLVLGVGARFLLAFFRTPWSDHGARLAWPLSRLFMSLLSRGGTVFETMECRDFSDGVGALDVSVRSFGRQDLTSAFCGLWEVSILVVGAWTREVLLFSEMGRVSNRCSVRLRGFLRPLHFHRASDGCALGRVARSSVLFRFLCFGDFVSAASWTIRPSTPLDQSSQRSRLVSLERRETA